MNSKKYHVVVGLGATGLSCVRFLKKQGIPVCVTDTQEVPPYLKALQSEYDDIPLYLGGIQIKDADCVVCSPGISLQEPAVAHCGVPVIGDIELLARHIESPVIAITGTNGKSTVTTLVAEMAKAAGIAAVAAGNIGKPVLDVLLQGEPALWVLELSSFQLETTQTLAPRVATILNVTPDHFDRYPNLEIYGQAKSRIYTHATMAVNNLEDAWSMQHTPDLPHVDFHLGASASHVFGVEENHLAFQHQKIIATELLSLSLQTTPINALGALAIGHAFGLPMEIMRHTLMTFQGLPHRCQYVAEQGGVRWYNDSKGTNVGATLAALQQLGATGGRRLIWIAGGVSKGADLSALSPIVNRFVKKAILMGESAPDMATWISDATLVKSMTEAVLLAKRISAPGDVVILSPACASFDMFKNAEERGTLFSNLVQEMLIAS